MNDKSPLTDRKNLLKPKPQAATRKKNSTENAPESKILQDTCRFESITRFNPHGNPITLEEAIDLKTLCWGSPKSSLSKGWLKGIKFNEPEEATAYGLKHEEGAPKPFLMTLQGLYLNQSLFSDRSQRKMEDSNAADVQKIQKKDKKIKAYLGDHMRPHAARQREMFARALSELFWRLGDEKYAVLATQGPTLCFDPPVNFTRDDVSEKLHLYRCKSKEEILSQIKKHFSCLTDDRKGGIACILYSIVLSKGFSEYEMQDQSSRPLFESNGNMSFCLSNLMLTGCATPYLQNGVFTEGKFGIPDRNNVGMLVWFKDSNINRSLKVGSRMKTPSLPIWITCVDNNWGVLFSPNIDLLKSHSAEIRFTLHYYSASRQEIHQKKDTLVQIDTREQDTIGGSNNADNFLNDSFDQDDSDHSIQDPLKMAIQTKWDGATVSWLSCSPYI